MACSCKVDADGDGSALPAGVFGPSHAIATLQTGPVPGKLPGVPTFGAFLSEGYMRRCVDGAAIAALSARGLSATRNVNCRNAQSCAMKAQKLVEMQNKTKAMYTGPLLAGAHLTRTVRARAREFRGCI